MAEIYKTDGLILKKFDYSNTSFIIHVLSSDSGIIHLIARGAKSRKSPFSGKLEFFNLISLDFIKSGSSDLYTLKECSIINQRKKFQLDINLFFIGSFILDIVDSFTWDIEDSSYLFSMLKRIFEYTESETSDVYRRLLLFFESKIISILGYRPDTGKCCRCGCELISNSLPVTYPQPGFLCGNCAVLKDKSRFPFKIEKPLMKTIDSISEIDDPDMMFKVDIDDVTISKILDILTFFLKNLAEKKIKSLNPLKEIGLISRDIE